MKTNPKFKHSVAVFLITAMLHLCWVSSFAWAEPLERSGFWPKGSKDIADAVAGACWLAQNSRTVRGWAGYVDERGQRIRVRKERQRRKGGEGRRQGYSRGIIRSR